MYQLDLANSAVHLPAPQPLRNTLTPTLNIPNNPLRVIRHFPIKLQPQHTVLNMLHAQSASVIRQRYSGLFKLLVLGSL